MIMLYIDKMWCHGKGTKGKGVFFFGRAPFQEDKATTSEEKVETPPWPELKSEDTMARTREEVLKLADMDPELKEVSSAWVEAATHSNSHPPSCSPR